MERSAGAFADPGAAKRVAEEVVLSGYPDVFVEDIQEGRVAWRSSGMGHTGHSPNLHGRRYVANRGDLVDAKGQAERIREAFVDRPVEKVEEMSWSWPKQLRLVGSCLAVMYTSDKWQKKRGDMIDYKHIAEGPQNFYVAHDFLRDFDSDPSGSAKLQVGGPMIEMQGTMPDAFAVLAPALGVQAQLNGPDGMEPNPGENLYQIDLDGVTLGAAKHPETGETFLILYDDKRVLALITGRILDVEKDGIVG